MTEAQLPLIDVTIDEVVLRGLANGQQYDFANALEARLTTLIEADAPGASGWRSRDESSRRVPPNKTSAADATSLGDAVAATISAVVADRRDDGR